CCSDADQARVRLSAGCALLKICEVPALWTFFSTALLTKLVCLITELCAMETQWFLQDKVKQVRLGFARRLTRGLCKEPGLPNDLLAFFPLSELSPDTQVCQQMREMLRKAIAAKRLRYRRLVLIEQVAVSTDQLINSHAHLLVEHSVGAAVFLLAFHPLFFAIDSWFDLYQVQCALKQLLEELITAAPLRMDDKFYKELFTAIHSSRNTLVPDDELANKNSENLTRDSFVIMFVCHPYNFYEVNNCYGLWKKLYRSTNVMMKITTSVWFDCCLAAREQLDNIIKQPVLNGQQGLEPIARLQPPP
ncbi:unnamed protein product, partial [Timema podura]|nr:unnamed protein product [Timema podura]